MVDYKELTQDLSIAGALTVGDLQDLKKKGFTTIICNRPDHEDAGQTPAVDIEGQASDLGMQFFHIPVTNSGPTMQAVQMTKQALDGSEGPAVAYCRTGMRSVVLWALATAIGGGTSSDDLLAAAAATGFDISGLRPTLDSLAG